MERERFFEKIFSFYADSRGIPEPLRQAFKEVCRNHWSEFLERWGEVLREGGVIEAERMLSDLDRLIFPHLEEILEQQGVRWKRIVKFSSGCITLLIEMPLARVDSILQAKIRRAFDSLLNVLEAHFRTFGVNLRDFEEKADVTSPDIDEELEEFRRLIAKAGLPLEEEGEMPV